jgi:hypothetical protein
MTDTIQLNGRTYRIDVEPDQDMRAPWEEHDGHGIVSDWVTRDKHAGEWLLHSDRHSKRFYDFEATMKLAKADCWGLGDERLAALTAKLGRAPTKGEITAEAVRHDYEYLRGWCNDEWHWVGVCVTDITDDIHAETSYAYALWGIGSEDDEYIKETAQDLAEQAYREYAIENRFSDAMACGI